MNSSLHWFLFQMPSHKPGMCGKGWDDGKGRRSSSSSTSDVNEGTDREGELIYGVSFLLPALYGHGVPRGEEQRRTGSQNHVIPSRSSGPSLMNSRMRIWSVMRLFAGTESSQMSVFICLFGAQTICNKWRAFIRLQSVSPIFSPRMQHHAIYTCEK